MDNTLGQSSFKDDKRIVTEVAFGVDPKLLGRKLATPFQRGAAMAVDALLVMLLTKVSGVFWALIFGGALIRAGRSREKVNWRLTRKLVRFFGIVVILITLINWSNTWFQSTANSLVELGITSTEQALGDVEADSADMAQVIAAGKLALAVLELSSLNPSDGQCDFACLDTKVATLVTDMATLGMDKGKARDSLYDSLQDDYFDSVEQKQTFVESHLSQYQPTIKSDEPVLDFKELNLQTNEVTAPAEENSQSASSPENSEFQGNDIQDESVEDKPVYSIVEYTKALIADLGLGFGWAALYFTTFSAWWKGQTPGKKLMGIRVVQLDGTYMSAWDAFGRYGGYGAGFATGLLGFAQIYWDDNRQSIQDKISATVVIQGGIE